MVKDAELGNEETGFPNLGVRAAELVKKSQLYNQAWA
jgi:hypothetical protein